MTDRVVQSLWVGSRLSTMERLSIASFLGNGSEFHLFVYDDLEGVPEGTTLLDAGEILPSSAIFQYRDRKTYSGFANMFRYKLLLERGGWWVDTDTICLRPFEFDQPYVFSSERHRAGDVVNNGILKAPPGSALMTSCWEVCRDRNPSGIEWGQTGPRLFGAQVRRLGLEKFVQPHDTFCPLPGPEWHKVLDPTLDWAFAETTRAIHLWNEFWRQDGRSKDDAYPAGCLFEQLKQRYLT